MVTNRSFAADSVPMPERKTQAVLANYGFVAGR